jgi:hypothetical protein
MLQNVMRAMKLDTDFYNTVERDTSFTPQALIVVVLANGLAGVGTAIAWSEVSLFGGIVGSIAAGLVNWVVWSALAVFIGTRLFGGTADMGEMLRVLGFAQAPLMIGVIPYLSVVGSVWMIVASVVAVREGLDFSTGRAIGTVVLGWPAWLILHVAVNAILPF